MYQSVTIDRLGAEKCSRLLRGGTETMNKTSVALKILRDIFQWREKGVFTPEDRGLSQYKICSYAVCILKSLNISIPLVSHLLDLTSPFSGRITRDILSSRGSKLGNGTRIGRLTHVAVKTSRKRGKTSFLPNGRVSSVEHKTVSAREREEKSRNERVKEGKFVP